MLILKWHCDYIISMFKCANKNRDRKMHLLGMDTCPSLNDIMEIR
jgi:hypothetical protein